MTSPGSPKTVAQSILEVLSHGHFVVPGCFAVMFLLYGSVLNTFTVFVDPMVQDLGCTRTTISFAMMIGAGGMGVAAPFAGTFMDRLGARPVMMVGAVMIGAGILITSRITALWQMYVLYSFVGFGLACATVIPCSLIISNWFVSRRGMAMGVMAMGTSTGGMLMSPIANWIIQNHGWRSAYVFSGAVILFIGFPIIAFLLKAKPSDAGLEPYFDSDVSDEAVDATGGLSVMESFSTAAFWQIAALMFIIGLVTSGVGVHIVPCLNDFGHAQDKSTLVWSITLLVMTVAKFLFGPIADRWGPKNAMAASCALMAISIALLTRGVSYEFAVVFAIIYGFGVGAPLTVNPLLVAGSLGVKNFGAIYGVLNLVSILGAALGPVSLAFASDANESYVPGLFVFMGLIALTGVVAYFIKSALQQAGASDRPQPAAADSGS